jgi:hypothetical protein
MVEAVAGSGFGICGRFQKMLLIYTGLVWGSLVHVFGFMRDIVRCIQKKKCNYHCASRWLKQRLKISTTTPHDIGNSKEARWTQNLKIIGPDNSGISFKDELS